MTNLNFSSPTPGKIEDTGKEFEVTIPNPTGGPPAIILLKHEQIIQSVDDRPDVVVFEFTLKLTEEQMMEIQAQWTNNKGA